MNEDCQYSTLTEPLFSVRGTGGHRRNMSLPEIMAALSGENLVSFEALQVHQQQAWYCFLVQLAVIALSRADQNQLADDANAWQKMLLSLTDRAETPWALVVDDLSQPAFLQPPVPEGSLDEAGFKADVETPDELDMLVTSRNHDLKKCRIAHPRPEHWLYALVTLQTLEGFLGRGNYGIVRMNGGFANRPIIGMSPELHWADRFRRDVAVLRSTREHLVDEYGYDPTGSALLWLIPWDGKKSSGIPLTECDPLFIEVCRRIRLQKNDGRLRCWRSNTKGPRIAPSDDLHGVTGDPWTPVKKSEAKALTVGGRGFTYGLLKDILLSGEYVECPALSPVGLEDDGGFLLATTVVRGQGKTEGFHHRTVPVPPQAIRLFSTPSEREKLGARAEARVELAAEMRRNVLAPALSQLLNAGKDGDMDWDEARPRLDAFDRSVDDVFFEDLWASLDMTSQRALRTWFGRLKDFAEQQLRAAIDSTPIPSVRRYRAISRAESVFYGSARNLRNRRFPQQEEEAHHEQSVPF